MERKEKAEAAFESLEMGRLAHSAFRVKWEKCLDLLETAGVDYYGEEALYRRYLRKIPTDLRSAITRKTMAQGSAMLC